MTAGNAIIQLRRGTEEAWAAANPVLAPGEPGVEIDTGREKLGDGTTAWNDLPYKGGSGASGLPIADATAPTTDTMPNPVSGVGDMTVQEFPVDTAVLALGLEGDTHPRYLLCADSANGLYLGDGDTELYTSGVPRIYIGDNGDGTRSLALQGNNCSIGVGQRDLYRSQTIDFIGGEVILNAGVALASDAGAPAIGGEIGDIYIRTDGGVGSTLYRCTAPGYPGDATWIAIL